MEYKKEKPPYYWFLLMVGMIVLITVAVIYLNWENIQIQLKNQR